MNKFNSWLNAVSIVFLATIIVDINLYWLRNPHNTRSGFKLITIILSLLLIALVIRVILKANKKKKS